MYADDTQLYISFNVSQWDIAKKQMEECLHDIRVWLSHNCLKLNDSKTEVLIMGQQYYLNQLEGPIAITIGDSSISPVGSARNLGMVFDSELKLVEHVNSVCRSCYASLRYLGQVRPYLTEESAATLVHAFVTSKLDSLNGVLTGVHGYLLKRLQLILNNAARIVKRKKKYDQISDVLQTLHWLPVEARINYKVLVLVFKALHGLAPQYVAELLHVKVNSRALRSSHQNLLCVPVTRLKSYGDRSFYSFAPRLWNTLPQELHQCKDLDTFKCALKTYLFKQHYNCDT
jgi:hypothetical protein